MASVQALDWSGWGKPDGALLKPLFHPHLVNGAKGDPVLYIDCLFQRRAILFDLGELTVLAPRKALRISDVFVSHVHMDHFYGFDRLLRLSLGRDYRLRLHGPPGFIECIAHRLQGYAWNLLAHYTTELVIEASEIASDGQACHARFCTGTRFEREALGESRIEGGVVLDEPDFRIRTVSLDHGIPSLAFMLEEKTHLNVWKDRLKALGLPTGPWLARLKTLVRENAPDDTPVDIVWRDRQGEHRAEHQLGFLRREVLQEVPGQKIAYVTDAAFTDANCRAITALASDADLLYIEAPFRESAADRAAATRHLTAAQAGFLARSANVRRVVPFHFSPRHTGEESQLKAEVMAAFLARPPEPSPEP